MRILIVGNGAREEALRRIALSAGHTLPDHGPWDQVVLSLPRSEIGEEAADLLPKGQHIICGMTDEAFDQLAKKRGWRIHRVLEDETYTLENALLTAEGAIHAAIGYSKKALSDSLCMVIGYGRIGQALTRLLRGLHIATIVVARRKESRKAAGKNSVSMEELPLVLPEMDVIFNTVPAMILDEEKLALVKKEAVLLELASKPYGINLKAAEEMGLAVHVEGGLPGRYCPELAAKAVLNYMEREAEKNE